MKIREQLKPALIAHWVEKAFRTFYPQVKFHGVPDAPNSFKALSEYKAILLGEQVLPVFNGACEFTIYDRPSQNVVFRAWHDCIHLENNWSFSKANELLVAKEHCRQLRAIGAPSHVINAVWFDVAGQVEYYYKHGSFVVNQRAFVQDCLAKGIDFAINSAYDTAAIC